MQIVLIILLVLLVYAWFAYPFLLTIISRDVSRHKTDEKVEEEPSSVTVLFSAYNEEKVIRQRLENLVEIGNKYSEVRSRKSGSDNKTEDKRSSDQSLTVLVGIDGSTDKTAQIAREFACQHNNITVLEFVERRGKVAVLKDLVRKSEEEYTCRLMQANTDKRLNRIFVFTDANTIFLPDTIEKLLSYFADPAVGGVCGRLEFREKSRVGSQYLISNIPTSRSLACSLPLEGFYWRWEVHLKTMESKIDSCLGANGAIYALRSELFWKDIPDNTIVDDFVIGMKVREQGFRMIYEPSAVAEEEFPRLQDEWQRRIRIGIGDYQALILCRKCLLPRYGKFAFIFWSHKILRWFTPHIALFLVASSLFMVTKHGLWALRDLPFVILTGTTGIILCSIIGRLLNASMVNSAAQFFRMCNYFLVMNIALLIGSVRFLHGDLKGYWNRTTRE